MGFMSLFTFEPSQSHTERSDNEWWEHAASQVILPRLLLDLLLHYKSAVHGFDFLLRRNLVSSSLYILASSISPVLA